MKKSKPQELLWCDRTLIITPIDYSLCISEKSFNKLLQSMKSEGQDSFLGSEFAEATTHLFTGKDSQTGLPRQIIVVCVDPEYVEKYCSHDEIIGILTHEAVHVWQYIKQALGEDVPSEEFEAYSIQRITGNLISTYNKMTLE